MYQNCVAQTNDSFFDRVADNRNFDTFFEICCYFRHIDSIQFTFVIPMIYVVYRRFLPIVQDLWRDTPFFKLIFWSTVNSVEQEHRFWSRGAFAQKQSLQFGREGSRCLCLCQEQKTWLCVHMCCAGRTHAGVALQISLFFNCFTWNDFHKERRLSRRCLANHWKKQIKVWSIFYCFYIFFLLFSVAFSLVALRDAQNGFA